MNQKQKLQTKKEEIIMAHQKTKELIKQHKTLLIKQEGAITILNELINEQPEEEA